MEINISTTRKINCQGPWQKNIILSINALPYWSGHYLLIKYVWPYLSLLPGNEVWDLFCQLPEFLKVDISIRKLIGTTLIQEIQVFYKQTKKWNDDLERKKKFIKSCLPWNTFFLIHHIILSNILPRSEVKPHLLFFAACLCTLRPPHSCLQTWTIDSKVTCGVHLVLQDLKFGSVHFWPL